MDITPSYIRHAVTLDRIEQFAKNNETKFVVFLRHPIKRAFSHYLHDLTRHHINQRGKPQYAERTFFQQIYDKSFFDHFSGGDRYIFPRYSDYLIDVQSRFGAENLLTLVLEKDFDDPVVLGQKLGGFVDEKVDFKGPWQRKNSFNAFPFYHYSRDNDEAWVLAGEELFLERNTFYTFDGKHLNIINVPDEYSAIEAVEASANWTRVVPESFVEQALESFYLSDIEKVEELTDTNLDHWKVPSELRY